LRIAFAADLSGRLDADPLNAPAPTDTLDPRSQRPNVLAHNRGDTRDIALKLRVPLGSRHAVSLFGLSSTEQRLLYDPDLKYDESRAPARRVAGGLLALHWQYATPARAARSFLSDV